MVSTPDRSTEFRSIESYPCCHHCGDYHPRWEYPERFDGAELYLDCHTCGRSFRPTDCSSVFQELFELVAYHRNAEHADKIVMTLLRHEHDTRELVGLTEYVKRVVFVETEAKRIWSREFDRHGVYDSYNEMLMRSVGDAEPWIELFDEQLAWIHPRYE